MAGVVVSSDRSDFSFWAHRPKLVEKLVHVADLCRPRGPLVLLRIVPMVTVILQHRSAAGDVVDHRVEAFDWKGSEILVSEFPSGLTRTGMKMNRAAADLRPGDMHIAAILLQHAGRRPIDVAEHGV